MHEIINISIENDVVKDTSAFNYKFMKLINIYG